MGGAVMSINPHEIVAICDDPIEKKTLFHFLPGTRTLSVAKGGCNFDCDFCQNWEIAKSNDIHGRILSPSELVTVAREEGFPSISFTYTEPLVWQDYVLESAQEAHKADLRTVFVSNGSFSTESLERLAPVLDACNIDLKGDETFYNEICHARMEPVVKTIRALVSAKIHVEITTMIIEGIHSEAMISDLGALLHDAGVHVWHLSRFFPRHRMSHFKPTSETCLDRMYLAAVESGVEHVYRGNSTFSNNLVCHNCATVIDRFSCTGLCPYCGSAVYGVWS